MDLWQLRILCRVVELKSFSKTAQDIHLSQPTVSSHIKDLETHYGCRLIDRMTREAVPTRAGEILYSYATRIIALTEQAQAAIAEHMGGVQGQIVVGGSTIPAGYILPQRVGAFIRQFPDVRIRLLQGDTGSVIEDVVAGRVEMGVVGARSRDRKIVQEPLFEDEMVVIVRPDHPWADRDAVSLAMLAKEPFIFREPGSGTLQSIEERISPYHYHLEDFHPVAEMGSTAAVVQGVIGGAGVSIVSRIAVTDLVRMGILKALQVTGIPLDRRFYLTRHRDRSLSPLGRRFVVFLKELSKTPPSA